MESLLKPYRVLDLSDEKGFLCGKLLGDFGADVIKVERPGGDPSRRTGPFSHDISDPEKSLFWFAYNTSKRGMTLNIETAEGKDIFKRLVKTADFVIETFPPGHLDSLGLGYSALSEINPRVILTSITPFGQSGPYKYYKSSDLVAWATGGLLYICGDPDRAPVRCNAEVAYCQSGLQAALGTILAHQHREQSGEGQHVDVSLQECVVSTLWHTQDYWGVNKVIARRWGQYLERSQMKRRSEYRCQDGHVSWQIITYKTGWRTRALVEWMDSQSMASDELKKVKWEEIDVNDVSQEQMSAWEEEFARFFLAHTKAELSEEAVKRGVLLMPCNTTKDCLESGQLAARDFWTEVEHPELGTSITYPGSPFKLDQAEWGISRRAPLIGEHNQQIYEQELGFPREKLAVLKQRNVI
jgi:crotonobetainyl-CoA:carnitine CoA-transferase CaiB-like acyl-CoA transferase